MEILTVVARSEDSRLMEHLAAAWREGLPWHHFGRLFQKRFEGQVNTGRRNEFWDPASEATGLNRAILKRFLAIMNKIDVVAEESGVPAAELVSPSYGAVEVALRIYDRDSEQGLAALVNLRERRTTIEALQKKLADMPAGEADPSAVSRSASLRARGILIERCENILTENAAAIFGHGSEVMRRGPLKHFRRLGFEVRGGNRILAGADLYLPDATEASKDSPEGLAQSLLLARYLPAFYLAFAPGSDRSVVEAAARALNILKMPSVGIIIIGDDGKAERSRPAIPGPEPVNADGYNEIKSALTLPSRAARG